MIRVAVTEDQDLVRGGLHALLSAESDMEVVAEWRTGAEAVHGIAEVRPDVVLMDVRMPDLDGIEATRRIVTGATSSDVIRVLIVTTFETDEYVFAALQAGASGFVTKDIEPVDLINAVRVVAAGDALLSPSVTATVVDHFARRPDRTLHTGALDVLTEREREVVGFVARGLSNDQIADDLVISEATVKTHVNRSMTKLGVHDRAQLVIAAFDAGLVTPGH